MTDEQRKKTVAASLASTINLFIEEANEIHRLMDVVQVPREANGEKLSMCQRVNYFMRFLMKSGVLVQLRPGEPGPQVH